MMRKPLAFDQFRHELKAASTSAMLSEQVEVETGSKKDFALISLPLDVSQLMPLQSA